MLSEWNFLNSGYEIINEGSGNSYLKSTGELLMYVPVKFLNTRITIDLLTDGKYYDEVNQKVPELTISSRNPNETELDGGYSARIYPNEIETALRMDVGIDNAKSDKFIMLNTYSRGEDWVNNWKSIRYSCYTTATEVVHDIDVLYNGVWQPTAIYRELLSGVHNKYPGYVYIQALEGMAIDNIKIETIEVN